MSRKAATAALFFAVLGLIVSALAAYTHYRMLRDPLYTSFCDVSTSLSCTEVYKSRFATFQGIPIALFAGIWFAASTLLSLMGLTARPAVRESAPGYLFAGSTLALAVALYLGYASFVLLKILCPLCLVTDVAVIGLFLVSGSATTFPMMSLPRRASSDLKVFIASPVAILLAVLLTGASVSALAFFPREAAAVANPATNPATADRVDQDQRSELERFMATAPRIPLVIPAQGAQVLIVKFNDYQCPACGQSYLTYKAIFAKYAAAQPGAVRLVMRDFPLNPNCNDTLKAMIHAGACDAAVAVRLARLRNRGDAMEEWLYTHQEGMTPQTVRQAAKEIGQVTDFEAKYAATLEQVKGDIAVGKQLHVSSTPTFFINGVKIDGMWAPQSFDQAIAYELQHAGAK
jgi:uncharacterized membrane protein/predicted DsbA family dithiol-disulfide isomerase